MNKDISLWWGLVALAWGYSCMAMWELGFHKFVGTVILFLFYITCIRILKIKTGK